MTSDKITDHHINECNEQLEVVRHHDGAVYVIAPPKGKLTRLFFQDGPIGEVGINGITNEALLAVVIDRLRGFQAGAFACHENAMAMQKIRDALGILHGRTRRRVAAGVEGTHGVDTKAEGASMLKPSKPSDEDLADNPPQSIESQMSNPLAGLTGKGGKWPGQMAVPPKQPTNEDLDDKE